MAAGSWKIYAKAKQYLGAGTIKLGVGSSQIMRMSLLRAACSASIKLVSSKSVWLGFSSKEISATGGYAAGGRTLLPATGQWTVGASAKQYKFTYTTIGLVFTASGAALGGASTLANIKYAIIKNSTGASGAGKLLCFCTLSTAGFSVTSGNTLTVSPAATGVFTLA